MKQFTLLMAVVVLLTGCTITRTAKLVEFSTGQVLTGKFTDSNATGGNVEIVMPSGEILRGRYSAVRNVDQLSFTSATISGTATTSGTPTFLRGSEIGTTRTVGGRGNAYALLTSDTPGSTLVMEVIVTYGVLDGHGFGEAKTNDGRTYRVQF